jgi:cytosine deaminase
VFQSFVDFVTGYRGIRLKCVKHERLRMKFDLIVQNAQLRSRKIVDVGITKGKIEIIGENLGNSADKVIDAQGRLVTESFVDPHLHLDKIMTGSLAEESVLSEYQAGGTSMTAIEVASRVKEHYVESEIISRVRKLLDEAERNGVYHIRAFADVDTKAKLIGINALLKIKQEFKDRIGIQIVAFPQDGIIRDPGTEELLYKAMDMGADLVGGIPWIEYTDDDARNHIDIAFEIAKKHNADIAMLTDDASDPGLRTTEYLAISAIKKGWTGRVTACHARATGLYNEVYHRKFTALLKKAEMGVVTDPHTGPLHVKVKELLAGGVTVALGQDDVDDAYYPYGRCNSLEVAFLASHLLWMMTREDREVIYDMITSNAAKVLGLRMYRLAVGNPANLIVLDAKNLREAFAYHSKPAFIVRGGTVLQK